MARHRSSLTRRTGVVGLAVATYRLWKRIPRQHRRRIIKEAAKHGPRIARQVANRRRSRVPKL
jgi:hypothetical protein